MSLTRVKVVGAIVAGRRNPARFDAEGQAVRRTDPAGRSPQDAGFDGANQWQPFFDRAGGPAAGSGWGRGNSELLCFVNILVAPLRTRWNCSQFHISC